MENGLNILSPKDRCVICSEERKSLLSSETVIFLYQPIMGADAAAVHAVLASSATTVPRKSGHLPEIGDILKTLDMEIPRFYDACCKLEALGLLRTFVHDVSNERRMIYQLLLPLSGQEFFKQTVLDTLLMSSVGRRRHDQLKQLFAPNVFAYSENSKEITKTLADVFDVRKENIQNLQINRVKNESLLEKSELNFDLKYFKQLLKHSFVEEKEVMEHLDEVKTMVLLYGLDELQLVKQLEKSFNVANNRVDFSLFGRYVNEEFESALEKPARNEKEISAEFAKSTARLSSEERQLVEACNYYAPLEFLAALKNEQGGYASNIEKYVVGNVVKANVLPGAVINVILHYFLCDEDNDQLSGKVSTRFEEFCNQFAKRKISDPVSAMDYLKGEVEKNTQKKQQRRMSARNGQTKKNVQKATLTDWDELAQKQNADLDYKHDLDEIEKLRNQMKNAKGR